MGAQIEDSILVITTSPKLIHLYLSRDVDNNVNYATEFITKHNELLAEHTIKRKISQEFSKYKHRNNIHKNRKR